MEDDRGDVDGAWKTFLVEHYWPGVTEQEFGEAAGRVQASSAQLAAGGVRIRYLHSTLVPEDEAAFSVFEAAASCLVEEAYRRADVRFERLVLAVETANTTNDRRQR